MTCDTDPDVTCDTDPGETCDTDPGVTCDTDPDVTRLLVTKTLENYKWKSSIGDKMTDW